MFDRRRSLVLGSGWPLRVSLTLVAAIVCHTLPSSTAQAEPASAPNRVVVLAPFEPDLLERIRGHLVGSNWDVRLQTSGAERPPSVTRAFAAAREYRAHAVLWVTAGQGQVLELRLLDVARSGLVERAVPWASEAHTGDAAAGPPSDPLARSAAYETAALIVRSTLMSIEQGTAAAEAVQAPKSEAPSPQPSAPRAREAAGNRGAVPGSMRPALRLSWRTYLDERRLRQGPALALGAAGDWLWVEAYGVWSLARRLSASPEGSTATSTRAEFELSELTAGLATGFVVVERARWQIGAGVAGALVVAQRRTTQTSDDLNAAEKGRTLGVEIDAAWRVLSPPLFHSEIRLAGELGLAIYARRPSWVLQGRDDERSLSVAWQPVQPFAAVGLAARF